MQRAWMTFLQAHPLACSRENVPALGVLTACIGRSSLALAIRAPQKGARVIEISECGVGSSWAWHTAAAH